MTSTNDILPLGRFGHHPDPAADFCVEVEEVGNEVSNLVSGFLNGTPPLEELRDRIARAMQFRTGGDVIAASAKDTLREVETKLTLFAKTPKTDVDHVQIWLEPKSSETTGEGRLWCQDNVWGDEAVCFVRSDKLELLVSALRGLRAHMPPAGDDRINQTLRQADEALEGL